MSVRSFVPAVPPEVIDDLRDRLRGTRWPDAIDGAGWSYGMDTDVLRSFVDTWLNDYDWPAELARIAGFEHVLVDVDGLDVHAVIAKSASADATPMLALHGWPSSFVQMLPLMPLLTDRGFDVVAMSLPGYGFSQRPADPGMDVAKIAGIAVRLMQELGYPRFLGRGSDLGAGVLQQVALSHPDALIALHLSGTNPYLGWIPDDLSDAEREFVDRAEEWSRTEMAYAMEHSTKPQTLAHALNDSPAGLASWVLEKFQRWSDGGLDRVYRRQDLLTNLTIYWATETIGSSMRLYYEAARSTTASWGCVEVPTAMAMSGADMFPTPREWAERQYRIVRWTDLPRGGHFLEWEEPQLIADDLAAFRDELGRAQRE